MFRLIHLYNYSKLNHHNQNNNLNFVFYINSMMFFTEPFYPPQKIQHFLYQRIHVSMKSSHDEHQWRASQ